MLRRLEESGIRPQYGQVAIPLGGGDMFGGQRNYLTPLWPELGLYIY
jgi:hypothetical protein